MDTKIKRSPEDVETEQRRVLGPTIWKLQDPKLVARFQRFCGIISTHSLSGQTIANRAQKIESQTEAKRDAAQAHFANLIERRDDATDDEQSVRSRPGVAADAETKPNETKVTPNGTSSESDDARSSDDALLDKEFIITNWFFYYLFSFGASLGNGVFYITFFPAWFWNIDGYVGRRIVLVWALSMFIGQAIKDVVRWPRPAAPPVAQLERRYALEYGMPSTHAMVGFTVPFAVVVFTHDRYEYALIYAVVFATAWCALVALSRLYMGMHSALDVIAGLLLAAALMIALLRWVDAFDEFQLQSRIAPLFTVGVAVALAVNYPELDKWSTSRGDTTNILGICAGIYVGSWLNFQLGYMTGPSLPAPFRIIWPTFHDVGLMALRMCIGIAIACATQAAMKACTYPLLCRVWNLDRRDPRSKQRLIVEVPYGFLVYGAIAFNVVFTATRVFAILNIEREMWYTEI
ncbi:PREDICTED: sphingosine-1-phosphate phosphatase 1-like [Priapulus caudatus]|uniref:Sphingosine-1-phosphate phosphatase 1-like n=1 Tax=Priapulus caudatus TaxID=37621 RepID=A0ABM1ERX7_PRICU|nr:PREDICTED: sphingosine-1-phosphate phosphatase 1-like [Priapulus caudatus]